MGIPLGLGGALTRVRLESESLSSPQVDDASDGDEVPVAHEVELGDSVSVAGISLWNFRFLRPASSPTSTLVDLVKYNPGCSAVLTPFS